MNSTSLLCQHSSSLGGSKARSVPSCLERRKRKGRVFSVSASYQFSFSAAGRKCSLATGNPMPASLIGRKAEKAMHLLLFLNLLCDTIEKKNETSRTKRLRAYTLEEPPLLPAPWSLVARLSFTSLQNGSLLSFERHFCRRPPIWTFGGS